MVKIEKIEAEEAKDSRNNLTIKVTVFTGNASGSFVVPSGASKGAYEAVALDSDVAIKKIHEIIAPALTGRDVQNQKEIDQIMIDLDGTPNKNNLGGNSMLGVSIACAKVSAKLKDMEVFEYLRLLADIEKSRKVPYLFVNLINGGKHAHSDLAFQEYHIVPMVDDAKEAVDIAITIQNTLRRIIQDGLGDDSISLGDEGGFAIKTGDIRKPLEFLNKAILENNFQDKVRLSLDVAASSFYKDGFYHVSERKIIADELLALYAGLIKEFNLFSIEDPFEENDFQSFRKLKDANQSLFVVADDLIVTNKDLLKKAIEEKSINAMIIKPNQIGTLSETLETMKLAKENGIEIVVSHRSGETDDDFIADLAYAFGVFGFKSGSPVKPERMIKYQRLINIAK